MIKTLCLSLAALVAVAASAGGQEPAPATAWELLPYRIQVLIAVEAGGELSRGSEDELSAALTARAASVVGGSWRLQVASAPAQLRHAVLTSIGSIDAESLPAAAVESEKVILLAVRQSDRGFAVQARELDVTTGLWNSTIETEAAQARALPQHAFRALLKAFAPLARIETVDGETATLRLRGGALARRDKELPAIAPGIAFRPVLVKSDTKGNAAPGSAELVPWTYLAPASISGSLVTCRVQTGLAGSPIPEYHPQRQRWALGVSPSSQSTTLRLVSQGESPAPLEGYEALDLHSAGPDGAGSRLELIGRSDRRGMIEVLPGAEAVRMLVIRRGEATLARLPIVPGLAAKLTIPLAGSDGSLAIEATLAELDDALIDLVAKREVLAAQIRAAVKARDMTAGQAHLSQLRDSAAADALAAKLDQAQQSIAAADMATQARLQARLDGLKQLLEKFRAESPAGKLEAELKGSGSN